MAGREDIGNSIPDILKSFLDDGANMRDAWFYRDSKKREIGPVIQDGRPLHPIEVKASGLVGADLISGP